MLNFAAFDLDGSSVPPPTFVSDFNGMRIRMLNRLLEEEKRRNPWLASKQYISSGNLDVLTPAFYESYYSSGTKTDWNSLRGEVSESWNAIPVGEMNDKDLESIKRRFLAERFAELACDGENAPFVARGLIFNDVLLRMGPSADIFLAKVRDIPNCRGAAELKAQDYGAIEVIRAMRVPIAEKTEIRQPAK
jgi:hypothetical protein